MSTYDLLLTDGRTVQWTGSDGIDAATRYADAHPGTTVTAWRVPRFALVIGCQTTD